MIRSRLLIAGGVGAVLSGLGLLLAELGGWGPCGPASSIAYIGGILNVFHVIFYAEVFGEFGTDYGLVNILLMFFIAALDWAVLAFLVTLVFSSVILVLVWALISASAFSSPWATKVMAVPSASILAVLPILWK